MNSEEIGKLTEQIEAAIDGNIPSVPYTGSGDIDSLIDAVNVLISDRNEATRANSVKTSFLANISHEVRTPMNAILGFAELILQKSEDEEISDFAANIKNASNNLLSIINDLLDISKIESGRMELINTPYYIHYLFSDVESIIEMAARKKNLMFKVSVNPELPGQLLGDIVRIRQVLINLLNNAVKFTKEGNVSLTADYEPCGEDSVTLLFTVEDTGIGIKAEDLGTIFDQFKQVDMRVNRGVEGTGLGLSISRQLVRMMDGDISVDSIYGAGTKFTIRIPQKVLDRTKISESLITHSKKRETQNRRFYAPSASILIVDDNEMNVRIMQGLLSHYQIDTDCVLSGVECLEKMQEQSYDMVFLDHMMPQMDGVETIHRIRSRGDHTVVVGVSANAIRGIHDYFVSQGFTDYISKPVEISSLESILRNYLPSSMIVEAEEKNEVRPEEIDLEIDDVDVYAGLAKCDYNLQDYFDILNILCDYGEDKCSELERFAAQDDIEAYTIAVHAIKSVAANIGAHRLCTMAKIHELAGKNGQADFIHANASKLIAIYRTVVRNIEAELLKRGQRV